MINQTKNILSRKLCVQSNYEHSKLYFILRVYNQLGAMIYIILHILGIIPVYYLCDIDAVNRQQRGYMDNEAFVASLMS